ncbi:MAG: hypothetical protein LC799_31840, partial [Actinobacteria bacterium]|nr:hypothetical protein [Actinomycetota bacterium]
DIADVKRDIKELEVTLRNEIKQLDVTLRGEIKQLGGRSASELKINELGPGWWLYMTICWGVGGWRGRRTLG